MNILAIDPGTTDGAYVIWDLDGKKIVDKNILENGKLLHFVRNQELAQEVYCEMVAHYGTGMPAGKETFETCVWIGRAQQITLDRGMPFQMVFRQPIKLHLCGSARAKDPNVRQALLDRLGPVGTKKQPGPLYGIATHLWAALAVAIYVAERRNLVAAGMETYGTPQVAPQVTPQVTPEVLSTRS